MNRRTVLRAGAVVGAASLAGCIDGVREHFTGSVQGVVTLEVVNEGEEAYNLALNARDRQGVETYDQSFAITPGERAQPSHLRGTDQTFRIIRLDEGGDEETALVEQLAVTDRTQHINITIYDDRLEIEVMRREEDDGEPQNETQTVSNETEVDSEDLTEPEDPESG